MGVPVFIGDEVTAAGYRLAGFLCRTPAPEEVADAVREARATAPLVAITAEAASELGTEALRALVAAPYPLLAIVPDARHQTPLPDLADDLRRVLGMES